MLRELCIAVDNIILPVNLILIFPSNSFNCINMPPDNKDKQGREEPDKKQDRLLQLHQEKMFQADRLLFKQNGKYQY